MDLKPQAWEKRGGYGCDHDDEALKRDPYKNLANSNEENYYFSRNLTCRVPAKGVDSVPSLYDCPDTRYNALCARLGDLPAVEISEYGAHGKTLVIVGAIIMPLGFIFGLVLTCFICSSSSPGSIGENLKDRARSAGVTFV